MKSVPSASKFESRKKWEAAVWKQIVDGLVNTNSTQDLEQALDILLTSHEKQQIVKRASAISLLRQGKTYKEIGEMLWMSPQTVSVIKKSMQAQTGHISHWTRNRKKYRAPLTEKEWRKLRIESSIESILDIILFLPLLPPPPSLYRDPLEK